MGFRVPSSDSEKGGSVDIEIGKGKTARRAYGLDEIAIVPSRRTRDPQDVDISWRLGNLQMDLPCMASALDAAVDPKTAGIIGRLGGMAVLNLEGLQTRYEDPAPIFEEIASLPGHKVTRVMQELYAEPIKDELVFRRVQEIKDQGVIAAASLTPQKVERYHGAALEAGLDVLVIQGTVVSAEHVSKTIEPLNLMEFIPSLDVPVVVGGCASYSAALHLMRTGAVGVLVGVGPGRICTTRGVIGVGVPQATAIADAAAARMRHYLETGEYVNVIADGGMRTGGDIAKAITCGADAVMLGSAFAKSEEAPGRGYSWGMATFHPTLPRGTRIKANATGTIEEILTGPAHENDGTRNLMEALRTSMATTGYQNIKEFQKAEVMIAPSLQTEGKSEQHSQGVGQGSYGA